MTPPITMAPASGLRGGSWAAGIAVAPVTHAPVVAPAIVAWALEYIQPLQQWFDELLGDPAQVDAVAASWDQVETTLVAAADDLARVSRQLDALEGRTVRTLQLRYEDLTGSAKSAADWSGSVAAAARLASSLVTGVRQFIFDFLDRLARLVGALFGFSLNPFSKIDELRQLIDAASAFWHAGRQLISNMFDAFTALIELLNNLGPAIEEVLTLLRETASRMMPVAFGIEGGVRGGIIGMVLGASVGAAYGDMLREGSDITRYDQGTLEDRTRQIAADLSNERREAFESGRLDTLADLVQANSLTDALGGEESTAIDIKLVRADDGTEHWVVSLPSTQEWLDTSGSGAMNDRNTNLSLMFMDDPVLKSQYERAVMRAMREAGMAPGDPVVFSGFSQGGIMAANLAADRTLPYDVVGVVTNGSPVDSFDIPKHIPVVAFQHANDPVAALDGNVIGNTPPNVQRVVLPTPGSILDVAAAHNNNNYAESIDAHASEISQHYGWMGGEVIDHQVFEGVQR